MLPERSLSSLYSNDISGKPQVSPEDFTLSDIRKATGVGLGTRALGTQGLQYRDRGVASETRAGCDFTVEGARGRRFLQGR